MAALDLPESLGVVLLRRLPQFVERDVLELVKTFLIRLLDKQAAELRAQQYVVPEEQTAIVADAVFFKAFEQGHQLPGFLDHSRDPLRRNAQQTVSCARR